MLGCDIQDNCIITALRNEFIRLELLSDAEIITMY